MPPPSVVHARLHRLHCIAAIAGFITNETGLAAQNGLLNKWLQPSEVPRGPTTIHTSCDPSSSAQGRSHGPPPLRVCMLRCPRDPRASTQHDVRLLPLATDSSCAVCGRRVLSPSPHKSFGFKKRAAGHAPPRMLRDRPSLCLSYHPTLPRHNLIRRLPDGHRCHWRSGVRMNYKKRKGAQHVAHTAASSNDARPSLPFLQVSTCQTWFVPSPAEGPNQCSSCGMGPHSQLGTASSSSLTISGASNGGRCSRRVPPTSRSYSTACSQACRCHSPAPHSDTVP